MSAVAKQQTASMPVATNVRILEKEYQIACPLEEREDLMRAADMLNQRMKTIRDTGKVVGLDRIAVMAALNIMHDLLKLQGSDSQIDDVLLTRIQTLSERVEVSLNSSSQLDI